MSEFTPTPWSRRRFLAASASVGAAGALLAGCGTSVKGGTTARSGDAGDTLFIAGFQWGTPTNFNPLSSTAAWPAGENSEQYLYESLVRFNLLTGKLEPGLSTGLQMPDEETIVIPLQKGIHFQDGKPLTADDVVYTFELAKRHSDLSYSSFWQYAASITAQDDHTVVCKLDKKALNPRMVQNSLAGTWILPKHVWEKLESGKKSLTELQNLHPVGTGPYTLGKWDQTQIVLERYDNYWGKSFYKKLPEPKKIVHPIFKDNGGGDLALQTGKVDVSQQFTPEIWKMWKDKHKPIHTWYDHKPYHVPGSIPMLVVNTTRKGLDKASVRRALGFAINYPHIAATAMSEYSVPANSSIILPTGSEQKYFDKDNVAKNGWHYDVKKATQILEGELKAKKGSDGIYRLPDGTRLGPWTVQTPTGWSDWQSALRIVIDNAKAIGIELRSQFPESPQVTQAVQSGSFDLAVWGVSGVSAASPWLRFRDVLDDRGVPKVGKTAFYNYGRFHDDAVAGLLDKAAAATGKQLSGYYTQLDTIFMKNAPMIPLMYRPLEFYEFSTSTWTGFPTAKNPTAPPQFSGAGNSWLFEIKHTKKS